MPRKRLRSNRFLPKYVSEFKDRHGKPRLRFRRAGYPSQYFTAELGTEEFREEYRLYNSAEAVKQATQEARDAKAIPGSVRDLLHRYYATPSRLGPTEVTRKKVRSMLERFAEGREDRIVSEVRFNHIDAIIAKARVKRKNDAGRDIGGDNAARKLRKELIRLFRFAKKLRWINNNPAEDSDPVKVAPSARSTGFYTWTEDDIAQYRAHWPLGTKQRLAMELILWTDQRKCDAIHLGRQHVRNGAFHLRQSKTGKALILPIARPLAAAIDAMPPSDAMCFVLTQFGKPYSVAGFGNWFRDQCDDAGLPKCSAHGLRKATMRRMAELHMPNKTMKSVSGHSKDDEVARYTAAANQKTIAADAIRTLENWEMSNPKPKLDKRTA